MTGDDDYNLVVAAAADLVLDRVGLSPAPVERGELISAAVQGLAAHVWSVAAHRLATGDRLPRPMIVAVHLTAGEFGTITGALESTLRAVPTSEHLTPDDRATRHRIDRLLWRLHRMVADAGEEAGR